MNEAQFLCSLDPPGHLEIALGSVTLSLQAGARGCPAGTRTLEHPDQRIQEASFGEGPPAWVVLCFQERGVRGGRVLLFSEKALL